MNKCKPIPPVLCKVRFLDLNCTYHINVDGVESEWVWKAGHGVLGAHQHRSCGLKLLFKGWDEPARFARHEP